jgi:hypothetical protein
VANPTDALFRSLKKGTADYNFVKRHITIRRAPAVEAGVINSAWTVADLVEMVGE